MIHLTWPFPQTLEGHWKRQPLVASGSAKLHQVPKKVVQKSRRFFAMKIVLQLLCCFFWVDLEVVDLLDAYGLHHPPVANKRTPHDLFRSRQNGGELPCQVSKWVEKAKASSIWGGHNADEIDTLVEQKTPSDEKSVTNFGMVSSHDLLRVFLFVTSN